MADAAPFRRLGDFTGAGYDKGRSIAWQALWFATQSLVFGVWWCPAKLRVTLLRLFGAKIGQGVFIRHHVRVLWPWKLTMGDHCWVGEGVWLLNLEPITIGSNVCLSQEAFLCTGSHDRKSKSFEYDNAPIRIDDGAWVAAQALLLRGVTVGTNAVVGARAVVSHSVDPDDLVPAGATR